MNKLEHNLMDTMLGALTKALHSREYSELVIAYSGGLDSSVLLYLANTLLKSNSSLSHLKLRAFHVHHGLSSHADSWELHCKENCESLGVPYSSVRVHLEDKPRTSLEQTARNARYKALSQSIERPSLVLTGQHLQDQIETFLLQFKRGAGLKGLSAMPKSTPFATDSLLLRPLLTVSRSELESYAALHDLSWVEDESNKNESFDRNFIRHQVMPVIDEKWPTAQQAFFRSINHIAESNELLDEYIEVDFLNVYFEQNLLIDKLKELSSVKIKHVIRRWLKDYLLLPLSEKQLMHVVSDVLFAKPDSQSCVSIENKEIKRFKNTLYCLPKLDDISQITIGIDKETTVLPDGIGVFHFYKNDADSQNAEGGLFVKPPAHGTKISIKFRHKNESFKIAGREGTRTLKGMLKQYHVPPWLRQRTPLLYYGDCLVAVGNLFVVEGYQWVENTDNDKMGIYFQSS